MYVPTGPRNKANSSNPVSTIYGPSTCLINTWTGSFIAGEKNKTSQRKKTVVLKNVWFMAHKSSRYSPRSLIAFTSNIRVLSWSVCTCTTPCP